MKPSTENFSAALTSQLPNTSDLAQLRTATLATIEKERARLKVQHIAAQATWIVFAIIATGYMWFGPDAGRLPRAPFLALFFFLWGGIELIKNRVNRTRSEVLAELKYLQLQVAELAHRTGGVK